MSFSGSEKTEFLNIKEAAGFLNVSEASLRRWTNSGRLECSRIGAKRERRFRRSDLISFLDRGAVEHEIPQKSEVELEGVSISYGKHICTLYENDLGRIKWSVPFLIDGLKENSCCFLVSTVETRTEILSHVRDGYADLDKALETGQLILSEGIPDGDRMCHFVERSIIMATKSGYRTFRLLGDMSWSIAQGMSKSQLFAYEHQFDREVGHSYPLVSVCQYDTRDFSGSDVLNALKTHQDTFEYPLSRFLAS